jgi:hypothetical protein
MNKEIVEAFEKYVSVKSILSKDKNGQYANLEIRGDYRTFKAGYLAALKITTHNNKYTASQATPKSCKSSTGCYVSIHNQQPT